MAMLQLVALFLLSSLGIAASSFTIEGRVYCDTCRAGFETSASNYIPGAKVRVECKNMVSSEVSYSGIGETDKTGKYQLSVEDEREDEICEVVLVSSPVRDCSQVKFRRDRARVLLTHNNGIPSDTRFANSLGFLKDQVLPICQELLAQYLEEEE